jgi:hypothetical protein
MSVRSVGEEGRGKLKAHAKSAKEIEVYSQCDEKGGYPDTQSQTLTPRIIIDRLMPGGEKMAHIEQALHEYFGLAYYRVRGRI